MQQSDSRNSRKSLEHGNLLGGGVLDNSWQAVSKRKVRKCTMIQCSLIILLLKDLAALIANEKKSCSNDANNFA